MGKLISVTAYAKNSTPYVSASPNAIQEDWIKFATNASLQQKQSVPSASSSINTALNINFNDNNTGENSVWLIGETLSTLVTNS